MWFWLGLASAVIGAADVILGKKALCKVSPAVLTWAVFSLSIPILIILVFWQGIPNFGLFFFIAALGSSLIFILSKMFYNYVLKQNLISKIIPLSAFSGFFTYIFGLIFLSESIRLVPLIGLMSIIFGAYILNVDQVREGLLRPFKLLFLQNGSLVFLLAVMLGSLTTILDKSALNDTVPTSPIFTALIEQIIMSAILGIYMLKKEKRTWFRELKGSLGILSLNSLVFLITGLLVFYGYGSGPVALVIGIKRLQIFFVLLMGYLFFKDKPTKHVWIATVIMIVGVLLIRLG